MCASAAGSSARPLINKAFLNRITGADGEGKVHYDPAMQFLVMQVGMYDVMTQSYDVLWQITVPVGTIGLHVSYVLQMAPLYATKQPIRIQTASILNMAERTRASEVMLASSSARLIIRSRVCPNGF